MVGTRKTPGGRTTVALDGSPGLDAVDDDFEEDLTDITDQFSVSFLLRQPFLYVNCLGPRHNISLGRQYRWPIPIQFCQSTGNTFGPIVICVS